MRNIFRKIFNLDKVEMLERMVVYKDGWIATSEKELDRVYKEVEALNFALRTYKDRVEYVENILKEKHIKIWKPVKQYKKGGVYYVVTQGGYYPIKGSTILFNTISEVTHRAVKNGFVVSTREEAEALQKAMRDLVK